MKLLVLSAQFLKSVHSWKTLTTVLNFLKESCLRIVNLWHSATFYVPPELAWMTWKLSKERNQEMWKDPAKSIVHVVKSPLITVWCCKWSAFLAELIINGKLGLTIDVKRLPLLEVTSSFHLWDVERAQETSPGFSDNYSLLFVVSR